MGRKKVPELSEEKKNLLKQLFYKLLSLYPGIEAITLTTHSGDLIHSEEKGDMVSKTVELLPNYFEMIMKKLFLDNSFKKYGLAYSDSKKFRLFHVSVNPETILNVFLTFQESYDKISPYALFLAEKVAQILRATGKEDVKLDMPTYNYEEKMYDRYKSQMTQMGFDVGGIYRFKFVIIGDGAVGKTSLVRQFVEKKFSEDYKSTIGLNIVSHSYSMLTNEIVAVIWDLGGQKHYMRYRQSYYVGAQAAFVVFDVTNRESFLNAEYWYKEIKEFGNKENVPIILIGNKSDLSNKREVTHEEGVRLADKLSGLDNSLISYVETSALTGQNVDEAFETIAYLYIIQTKEEEEKDLQEELYALIVNLLDIASPLALAFITESSLWSPALKIITGIPQLGEFKMFKAEDDEKIYHFTNGLVLKGLSTAKVNVADCDGVYSVFDVADRQQIDPQWRELLLSVINTLGEDKPILIGIRTREGQNWSQILEQFKLGDKMYENLSFFQLGDEFQLDMYEQLKNLLNRIKFS